LGNFSEGISSNIWFKGSNTSGTHVLLNDAEGATPYEIRVLATGHALEGLKAGSEAHRDFAESAEGTNYLDGQWHMFTLVYDNTYIYRYVDSVLYSQTTLAGELSKSFFTFRFGKYGSPNSPNYCR
jgi:hypothetical protein